MQQELKLTDADQKILQYRLMELEAKEQIINEAREIQRTRLWKQRGFRSLQHYCESELGYKRVEARQIAIHVGAIVTLDQLTSTDPVVQRRVEVLKAWRRSRSIRERVPAYRVFSNRALMELATKKPESLEQLETVSGFGAKRIRAYGLGILESLRTA